MSIRAKSLLVVSVSMSGLILAILSFFWLYWRQNISRNEETDASRAIQAVKVLLRNELHQLEHLAVDWAEWDDTYAFILDKNPDYIQSNLMVGTYENLQLNLMLYVDSDGQIVYGNAYDLQEGELTRWPTELEMHLNLGGLLIKDETSSRSGILMLPDGPMLIVARPILTSEGMGPVRGTYIIGRYLDQALVEHFSMLTQDEINFAAINASDLQEDFLRARTDLLNGAPFIKLVDESRVYSYALLKDIYDKPVLIMRVSFPRLEYNREIISLRLLMVSLGVTGMVFILLTLVLLEWLILARLNSMKAQVMRIGEQADPSQRLSIQGKDELAELSLMINKTLEALQLSLRALAESEQRFRQLVENAPVVIYTSEIDSEGINRFATLNPAFEKLTGWQPCEWVGREVVELIPPEERALALNRRGFAIQNHAPYEMHIQSKAGERFTCEVVSTPLMRDGQVIGELGIILDITHHKQLEEQMRVSLSEKETLLKEIHHRVKNNLQVISSILSLQARNCNDEQMRLVLHETQSRVRSIALIHEKLYHSGNLVQVNLGEYISGLIDHLKGIYSSYAPGVRVLVNTSDLTLDIDRAVSCGLIISELVTNAFKHAFSPSQTGKIEISLCSDGKGNIVLQVANSGKGLPKDDQVHPKTSLGLQLVDVLVHQLKGHLELYDEGGARFVITFPQLEF